MQGHVRSPVPDLLAVVKDIRQNQLLMQLVGGPYEINDVLRYSGCHNVSVLRKAI